MAPEELRLGATYSNGAYGRSWGVRMLTRLGTTADTEEVGFKGVAGQCRRKTGHCSRAEFAAWAKYEVALNENSWHRIGGSEEDIGA